MNSNPLSQYFRQPAIYVKLPSEGNYYPPGALEPAVNNEYPVLPMTTLDEITYRTPDALFNGSAMVSVIESCVPNIKDAWNMPGMDIDTVLVAIRIATYGHELDITSECPSCKEVNEYGIDLRIILDGITPPNYKTCLTVRDLDIFLRPMSYQQMNENSMIQFEEQKQLAILQDSLATATADDDKLNQLGQVLKKITQITTRALAQNIALVKAPQAHVTDAEHINEWLANCDRSTYNTIRDYIIDNKQKGELTPLDIKCGHCEHEYKQPFTLDMSNFFVAAS
jgi:hypothetical protein